MTIDTTPTLELLARAIEVSALKQGVYAANIANAGIEGYRRMEVTFDRQLEQVSALLNTAHGSSGPAFGVAPAILATDSAVKLDEEMAYMAKNALRHQILLAAFDRSMGTLRLAVREGRD